MLAGLCVLLLGAGEARAQRGLPGQLGIGLSMGTLDGLLLRDSRLCYRYWAGLELARYNRNHSYWNFGAGYLHKDYAYDGVTGRGSPWRSTRPRRVTTCRWPPTGAAT